MAPNHLQPMSANDSKAVSVQPPENPPSYDMATYDAAAPGPSRPLAYAPPAGPPPHAQPELKDTKSATSMPTPSMSPPPTFAPPTTVHHYVNPVTGEHIASLLPPDHPHMRCLQEGTHVPETHYGLLGILAAVFWVPLVGVGLCLLDRRVKCRRCGYAINDGFAC